MTEGPKRLDISDGKALGDSLAAARSHLPSTDRLAAVAERLAQAGVVVAAPDAINPLPEAPAAAPAGPSSGLFVKGAVGALATGGLVATLMLALPKTETPAPPAAHPITAAAPAATSEVTASSSEAPEKRQAPAPAPARTTATEQPREPALPEPVAPAQDRPAPAPEATSAPAPARATSARTVPDRPISSPAVEAPPEPAPVATQTHTEQRAESDVRAPSRVVSEVELLKEARNALSSDPEQALLLTRRHGAEFPFGAYAQEREFIAISALSRLGRKAEAGARADTFRKRYPRSAYLPQLERLLGAR